jgi:hypothetical protein
MIVPSDVLDRLRHGFVRGAASAKARSFVIVASLAAILSSRPALT